MVQLRVTVLTLEKQHGSIEGKDLLLEVCVVCVYFSMLKGRQWLGNHSPLTTDDFGCGQMPR
jgi:hypothetical protein